MMFTKRERDNLIIAATQHLQNLTNDGKGGSYDYTATQKALNTLCKEHELDVLTERAIHD